MENSVRKNFVLDAEVASHLEELAKETKHSMTALVQEMIEERYKKIKAKKRVEAFKAIDTSFSGTLTEVSIQSIKAEKDV